MSTAQLFLKPKKSGRRYFRAAFDSEGYIRPWMSAYGKGEKRWPGGAYYLRIEGNYQRLSNDPSFAMAQRIEWLYWRLTGPVTEKFGLMGLPRGVATMHGGAGTIGARELGAGSIREGIGGWSER